MRPREKFSRAIRNFLPHSTSLPRFQAYSIDMHHLRSIARPPSSLGEGDSSAAKASEKKSNLSFGAARLQSVFQRDIRPATGPYVENVLLAHPFLLDDASDLLISPGRNIEHGGGRWSTLAVFPPTKGCLGNSKTDGGGGRGGYHRGAKSLAYAFCTLKSRHARPTLNWNPAPTPFPPKVDSRPVVVAVLRAVRRA